MTPHAAAHDGPSVIASDGQISGRQGLWSIRQGRIEGCEMCTVLTSCIDAFAAAMLDGYAMAVSCHSI
jgi:hypothetical protein